MLAQLIKNNKAPLWAYFDLPWALHRGDPCSPLGRRSFDRHLIWFIFETSRALLIETLSQLLYTDYWYIIIIIRRRVTPDQC